MPSAFREGLLPVRARRRSGRHGGGGGPSSAVWRAYGRRRGRGVSNENLAGAVEQLRRVAVALGYQRVWPHPRPAPLWVLGGAGGGAGGVGGGLRGGGGA